MKKGKQRFQNINYKLIIVVIASFALGFLSAYLLFKTPLTNLSSKRVFLEKSSKYNFVNPLLDCGEDNFFFKTAEKRKTEVENLIIKSIEEEKINEASIYFLNLDSGLWFSTNPDKDFTSASLIKLFILITYFKEAEESPQILEKKILFENDNYELDNQTDYIPLSQLEEGKGYSVLELIEQMVVYSDNSATHLLVQEREDIFSDLEKIYNDLDLNPRVEDIGNQRETFFSSKDYAKVFRVLYNATYLNHDMSEKTLEILSRVEFNNGIASGVEDKGIKIANKFGERTRFFPSGKVASRQLHDCGIIYHPESPYLLCIMTRGMDYQDMEEFIGEVSSTIYSFAQKDLQKK